MYESFLEQPAPARDHREVGFHVGNVQRFLADHDRSVQHAVDGGVEGIRELGPHLMHRLSDARMLRAAWNDLRRQGDKAPGPDGMVASDLDDQEVWRLLRAISKAIRQGHYRPGPERRVSVPKGSGRGERTLTIQNLADRVVGRAVVQTIEGLFEPSFDNRSFGFRPGKGRLEALATAMSLSEREDRPVWLVNDIRDAFERVPRTRLLDVVAKTLPGDVVDFIGGLADTKTKRGLRQGSPLSPLLLNVYADHFVDRVWRRERPDVPLLRTVDDLLALCRDRDEARDVDEHLRRLLTPAGLPLKYTSEESVHDLGGGDVAEWLGFEVDQPGADGSLRVGIGESVWDRLSDRFAEAHRDAVPPLVAEQAVLGWIGQLGPCYAAMDRPLACRRVRDLAEAQAFDEIATVDQLLDHWRSAHERWLELRDQVAAESA